MGLPVALTVIISRIVNICLKALIDRPRPEFKLFPNETETSFPSGHSQNNMALYIALLLVLLLIVKSPILLRWLKVVLIALPFVIGITRLYFGVHYISDVIAGWSVGALLAIVIHILYFKVLNERKTKNADKSV
ncbi:MAG: phosphatase PAP2 family protein [Clostridia bacterium]|nr:phosphatase PAP2 family protein [Clostridia bacterium]